MSAFKQMALKQLADQQVRFAPPHKQHEQAMRAEKLLSEIEEGKQYPYQYICFRVTEFRPDSYGDLLIDGAELVHDLREMIRLLKVLTLDEVSKRLNVSTKTVRRWKGLGLVGRRIVLNGRAHLGFLQGAVDDFVAAHTSRVERGGRFSQLSDVEREQILCQAKRLAADGLGLTDISRNIANGLGRSTEAVRYTIKNFDREHPQQALFPRLTGPLDVDAKGLIYHSYRRGVAVETLARRFQRTRTSVYRAINEVRAQHLLEQPLDFIMHPSFDEQANEAEILGPMPDAEGL